MSHRHKVNDWGNYEQCKRCDAYLCNCEICMTNPAICKECEMAVMFR